MQDHSENTKRIAKNTLMLYGRMLFSMVVSLYTSRVVLNTLGVVDYGIYGVVGGFVSMFSLISSSLSSAVSRFLTFELGRGDQERLNKAFSTSLLIHIVLAIAVLVIAETVGVWFVNNKMTIPADRLYAANWVFQASIFSFMFGLFSVPYNASIVSHEKMSAFAYIGILDTTMKLLIVLFIAYSHWHFDKLIVYAMLLVAVSIVQQCMYMGYCRNHFEECRLKISFDKGFWKEISSFAGWNFIGCTAGMLKDQGINVLLNLMFGPILNAARGIASTVNGAVITFVNNFMTALNPQITKSYALDDYEYCYAIVRKGACFSYYILLILGIPIILEADFILSLWLKQYPEHTLSFVRLVILLSMMEVLSNTQITLMLSTGNIKCYQLVVGGIVMLNFPLTYVCFKLGMPPESSYIIAAILSVLCLFIRLLFLSKLPKFSVSQFIKEVILRVLAVSILSLSCPLVIYYCMTPSWLRLIVICATSCVCSCLSIFFVGCTDIERFVVIKNIKKFLRYNC